MPATETGKRVSGVYLGKALAIACVVLLFSLASANPGLTMLALCVAAVSLSLLYRTGEPPILLFVVFVQWLQVSVKLLEANVLGLPVNELSAFSGNVESAIAAGSAGLLALVVGMRFGVGRHKIPDFSQARNEVVYLRQDRLFLVYLVSFFIAAFVESLGGLGGLKQAALALTGLKWVFLFVLAYSVFLTRRSHALLTTALIIELAIGLGGFFSGFKTIFFILMIGVLAAGVRMTTRKALALASLAVPLLYLCVWWSAIKVDYRRFINEGTGGQVVLVPFEDRVRYLADSFIQMDGEDVGKGVEALLERISYVDYFALVIDFVPEVRPHEQGKIIGGAIMHVLRPRILFPDKAPLPNDSEMTMLYTGTTLAGDVSNTSISMGYVADAYIDFGFVGMLFPIFVLGLIAGWMYGFLLKQKRSPLLLNYGLSVMVLIGMAAFETSFIKLLGGLITVFAVAWLLQARFAPAIAARLFRFPKQWRAA